MKWNTELLIVGLLSAAGGCGGSGDAGFPPQDVPGEGDDPSPVQVPGLGGDASVTALGQCSTAGDRAGPGRIWIDPDGGGGAARLLIAETGEFRWSSGDGTYQQVFGTFQADGAGASSTDALWVWVDGLTFLETTFVPVDLRGSLAPGSLTIDYQTVADSSNAGTYTLAACDSVYLRESSLAILAGTYTGPGDSYSLAIDDGGAVFYQNSRTGCVGNGRVELIEPAFNMYRVVLEFENCTAELHVELNGLTFTGLGYLGDSGDGGLNDLAEFVLSSDTGSRYLMWNAVARR